MLHSNSTNPGPSSIRFTAHAKPVRAWSRPDIIIDEAIEYGACRKQARRAQMEINRRKLMSAQSH